MNKFKLFVGSILMALTFGVTKVYGQANDALNMPATNLSPVGIFDAMSRQLISNPSALMVIVFLCIFAWMLDDSPLPAWSVKWVIIPCGAFMFHLFALESSVPAGFPHPQMVFVVNGTFCGFLAIGVHRQVIARMINLWRGQFGSIEQGNPKTQLKSEN